jgi:uncharacterized protein (TIGR00369 family)
MPEKQLNPAYVEGVKGVLKSAPYFDLVSLELEDLLPGKAVFKIPAQQKHMNPFQRVHGGVFATIIDATTFWAIYSQVDDGLPMTTVELKINYLAPTVEGKTMIAYGNAVKVGKTLSVAEARLEEAETGRLIGFGTATCMIISPPLPKALAELPAKFI